MADRTPTTEAKRPIAPHGLPSPDGKFLWDAANYRWEPRDSWKPIEAEARQQDGEALRLLRRVITEGRSARDTRDFFGNDSLVIAAFDRRTWKEAIALVDAASFPSSVLPLGVERIEAALSSHQAAMDDQRKKYHCGPATCSHDLASRLAHPAPEEKP